ncbi:hypothetical protein BC938DRAFT_470739, partial [Jimgerdemannia flammicorona]
QCRLLLLETLQLLALIDLINAYNVADFANLLISAVFVSMSLACYDQNQGLLWCWFSASSLKKASSKRHLTIKMSLVSFTKQFFLCRRQAPCFLAIANEAAFSATSPQAARVARANPLLHSNDSIGDAVFNKEHLCVLHICKMMPNYSSRPPLLQHHFSFFPHEQGGIVEEFLNFAERDLFQCLFRNAKCVMTTEVASFGDKSCPMIKPDFANVDIF